MGVDSNSERVEMLEMISQATGILEANEMLRLLAKLHERQVRTFVFVNNHYAGHAPATVRRLQELFTARSTPNA